MAGDHLASGNDVIVPQFLARPEFIDELAATSAAAGARFVEIALMIDRVDFIAAFERRSAEPESSAHRDAAEAVANAGGLSVLQAMYDDYVRLLQSRESAVRVGVEIGDVDATVARVESAISTHG